ncbi:hypothetical protein ES703_93919 [subsurface metagenome]
MQTSTVLKCSHKTAAILFILIGSLFTLAGCLQLYKLLGLTPEQTADQVAQDQKAAQEIIQQVRWTSHEIISTAIAAAGTILSGLLARWLGTEKKITKVLIAGIEKTNNSDIKASVQNEAFAAGIQPQLHARVKALT